MSKEIVLDDYAFLVSETNEKGIITFASDDFCRIAGYTVDELIGKPHNLIRHKDMPKVAFEDLWKTIKSGKVWNGYVKNATKSGDYYWVYASVYPTKKENGTISYLSCRRKPNRTEVKKHEQLYTNLKALEDSK